MTTIGSLNDVIADLLSELLQEARQKNTYGEAIKYLKSEQDKIARKADANGEIDRAVAILANRIYGEAIWQISSEAKKQPIQEAENESR